MRSKKFDVRAADFKLFTALWNQYQKQRTPDIHLRICEWLEGAWISGDTHLLLMAFRSCGKSTLVGLFAAWLLYRKPELRIMVLAADSALAGKMVRNVKRIIERHPLTGHLRPKNADQWAGDRFTVKRAMEFRDPSMLALGITSNMTGSRADVIICDDVEVPNTCDTADKRENLRERLSETSYILVPGGTQLYVGTPHSYYSIYADAPRAEIGEVSPFLANYKRLKLPILANNSQSVWPERFSERDIERIRIASGPHKFESQMMLRPVNIADGRLDVELLRWYDGALDYTPEIKTLFINGRKMVGASAYWDPAFGSAKGDNSVLAVVFTDEDGNFYLHHVEYIKISKGSGCIGVEKAGNAVSVESASGGQSPVHQDEASAQCAIVAEIAGRLHLPSLVLETNGIGRFLPSILRNMLVQKHVPCRVQELAQSQNKDQRILEGFDALLAARRLYVHHSVRKTPFVTEMREWQPGRSRGHDDGLDAAAGALMAQPDRLKRLYGRGDFGWMKTGRITQARTDYHV